MLSSFQKLFLAATLVFVSFQSMATTVIKAKKWALEDYTTATEPRGFCIAWTYLTKGSTIYRLEFHRMKNETTATEVLLRQTGAGENTAAWQITIGDTGEALSLGLRAQDATSKFFWPVPRTESLVKTLLAGGDVRVYSKGGAKEVKFDLAGAGFSEVWAQMQAHCSGQQQINNADFEREFMAKSQRPVDPLLLTPEIINTLKSSYSEGYHYFLLKLAKIEELKALRLQYKAQLDEFEPLLALANQISNRDLPALRQQQATNENLKTDSDRELATVNGNMPALEQAVVQAREILDRAQQVIAPYTTEHANLSDALQSARAALSNAQSRLSSINSSIVRTQSELRDLDSELQRLDRDVSDARNRLSWAQREYSDADMQYRQFNPQQEERSRLQNNYQYQNARNTLQSAESQMGGVQAQQQRAQSNLQQANQALSQCQATAGADCSSQQAQVNSASSELQQANSQVQQLDSQIQQSQRTINSIENDVRSEVRRLQNSLADRVQRARYEVDRLNNIINRGEQRMRDIRLYEIPNGRNNLDRLQREASTTESEITADQSRVRQSERDLDSFEVRTGWATKKSSLDSAQNDFDAKTETLASARQRKTQLEQTIQNCLSERTRLAKAIDDKTDLLNRSNARLAELRTQLQPYENSKARIDLDMQALQASLNAAIDRFDGALPR